MECNYHNTLDTVFHSVWERIHTHYIMNFFDYWLGDESDLSNIYKEVFEVVLGNPLTPEDRTIVEKKGINLENAIGKWCSKWKREHPDIQDGRLPRDCLKQKIHEYLIKQFNKPDIIRIIGAPC